MTAPILFMWARGSIGTADTVVTLFLLLNDVNRGRSDAQKAYGQSDDVGGGHDATSLTERSFLAVAADF